MMKHTTGIRSAVVDGAVGEDIVGNVFGVLFLAGAAHIHVVNGGQNSVKALEQGTVMFARRKPFCVEHPAVDPALFKPLRVNPPH